MPSPPNESRDPVRQRPRSSKDYVLAYMWINLAVANSTEEDVSEQGVKRRDELEKNMTPEQITEAQRRSREWKPKGRNE